MKILPRIRKIRIGTKFYHQKNHKNYTIFREEIEYGNEVWRLHEENKYPYIRKDDFENEIKEDGIKIIKW